MLRAGLSHIQFHAEARRRGGIFSAVKTLVTN
jgi:hypothetical protein